MSRIRLAAALLLSSGLLVACGGGDDGNASNGSDSSSSDSSDSGPAEAPGADTATGTEVSGEGFTFNAPEGWEETDGSAMPSINFLALATDPDDDDGFPDNVNVISDPTITQVDDVEELGKAVEKVLNGAAKDVELRDPQSVDGEDAAVVTATFTQGDVSYRTLQYAVTHDDKGYVVTFSYSEDRPEDEQVEVAESVMASWAWAS